LEEKQMANQLALNLLKAVIDGGGYWGWAVFYGADLQEADLHEADLQGANLQGADLRGANLSGARGLLATTDWIFHNLEKTPDGLIVYKRIGQTTFNAPESWKMEPGSILTEVCNPCRTSECACGVNFGTLEWCKRNYTDAALWRCLIRWEWAAGIVVPYHTDGKARCEKLELVERVAL